MKDMDAQGATALHGRVGFCGEGREIARLRYHPAGAMLRRDGGARLCLWERRVCRFGRGECDPAQCRSPMQRCAAENGMQHLRDEMIDALIDLAFRSFPCISEEDFHA